MKSYRCHLWHRVRNTEEYDGTIGGKSTVRRDGVNKKRRADKSVKITLKQINPNSTLLLGQNSNRLDNILHTLL